MNYLVQYYIDQIIRKLNLRPEDIELTNQYIPYSSFTDVLPLGIDYAIVTEFVLLVSGITDMTKGLYVLKSPITTIDYKKIYKIDQFSASIQIMSDFVSLHQVSLEMVKMDPVMFASVYSGYIKYVHVKIKK